MDVELGDALRDVDVEGVEVNVIATPGQFFAGGVNDQAGEVVDGTAGAVGAGDPFGGGEGDGAGRDWHFDIGMNELAGRVGEVGGDEDGRMAPAREANVANNCDEWQNQGPQMRWMEHGCLLKMA